MDTYIFYGLAVVLLLLSFIKDKKKTKMVSKKEVQTLYDNAAKMDQYFFRY
ncbi:hypothetical protein [Anaerosacchariphilus polymeriproducens]|uniref:hypothetical protein n=1 Tax=Anaerosacchariphilus polymeriproducens TaxID=1812858 RepID=UPI0012D71127|nr:hypothetical protein [Anaerosacchariphilus polymeriproducens]